MIQNNLSTQDEALISAFNDSQAIYANRLNTLYASENRVAIARVMLKKYPKAVTTWDFIERLPTEELLKLIETIVEFSTHTSCCIMFAIPILLRIPKQWLLENLDKYYEPLIEKYKDETYIAIISVYMRIDLGKALEWAKKALNDENADIKEVGEYYLAEFRKVNPTL